MSQGKDITAVKNKNKAEVAGRSSSCQKDSKQEMRQEDAEDLQKKIMSEKFDFKDFLKQTRAAAKVVTEEKEKPELLAESPERRKIIAKDSGKTEQQVSQLVAQIFQMRVKMKNLMGAMEGGANPAFTDLADAMKAEQKGLPGTARRKKKAESRKKFVESASRNPGPRGFGSGNLESKTTCFSLWDTWNLKNPKT
ncbi:hypothetical protein Bca4012_024757 [Brassica carinata]